MLTDFGDLSAVSQSPHQNPEENIDNISMPMSSSFLDDSNIIENVPSISALDYSQDSDVNYWFSYTEASPDDLSPIKVTKPKLRSLSLGNEIQIFRKLSQKVDDSRMRCNRAQLIINILEDILSSNSELSPDLRDKSLNRLRNYQLSNVLKYNSEIRNAINIDVPLNEFDLNVKEIDQIRSVVKRSVSFKCSQLKAENESISDILNYQKNRVSLPGSILNEEEGIILNRISDVASLIGLCTENIRSVITLHDELYDLHATKFRKFQKAEMESFENKTMLLSLQIKNLNYMIQDAFIQQFDKVPEAVSLVYKELQLELHEAEYMLQKRKILKDKYDQVRGTRFDEILNEYKQLRDNYRHKAWALKQLNN